MSRCLPASRRRKSQKSSHHHLCNNPMSTKASTTRKRSSSRSQEQDDDVDLDSSSSPNSDKEDQDDDEPLLLAESETGETVQVDFAFCDTQDQDAGSLSSLLSQGVFGRLLGPSQTSSFARLCAEQRAVGTTLKQENEQDVFAFASVVSAKFHVDLGPVKALRQCLVKAAAPDQAVKTKLVEVLGDGALGIVVRERLVNVLVADPFFLSTISLH